MNQWLLPIIVTVSRTFMVTTINVFFQRIKNNHCKFRQRNIFICNLETMKEIDLQDIVVESWSGTFSDKFTKILTCKGTF